MVAAGRAQCGQMQARPRASAGIRASACGATGALMHQQLAAGAPAATAQALAWWHRGQVEAEVEVDAGVAQDMVGECRPPICYGRRLRVAGAWRGDAGRKWPGAYPKAQRRPQAPL